MQTRSGEHEGHHEGYEQGKEGVEGSGGSGLHRGGFVAGEKAMQNLKG